MNPILHLVLSVVVLFVAFAVIFVALRKNNKERKAKKLAAEGELAVENLQKYPLGTLVEYKGHRGGPKWGKVVAARNHGLHGQARINVGPQQSVWRSWARLEKVI